MYWIVNIVEESAWWSRWPIILVILIIVLIFGRFCIITGCLSCSGCFFPSFHMSFFRCLNSLDMVGERNVNHCVMKGVFRILPVCRLQEQGLVPVDCRFDGIRHCQPSISLRSSDHSVRRTDRILRFFHAHRCVLDEPGSSQCSRI